METADLTRKSRLFRLILGYRQVSLLPPLIQLFIQGDGRLLWFAAFGVTVAISIFSEPLNSRLQQAPSLLLLDLLFVAGIVYLSGGWQSPYYLFAVSPLIIAAFFFQLRGALLAAVALLPLYSAAIFLSSPSPNGIIVTIELVGIFLLAGTFGYASVLLRNLHDTNDRLVAAHLELTTAQKQLADNAVQQERLRIARDMHDTISQSLFGIAWSLNGCIKLLPQQPAVVRSELLLLEQETQTTREQLRHTILDLWPNELTAEQFSADLHRYLTDLTDDPIDLDLDIRGDFTPLTPFARRNLYRICQESLANIARHANADQARVCLDIDAGRAKLLVRDNGCGFDPTSDRSNNDSAEHFGLRGMADRAKALGGTFDVFSTPGAGTSVVVDIPVT